MMGHTLSYSDEREFFTRARQWFEELELFPTGNEVKHYSHDRLQGLRALIRSFGWPPPPGDGCGWKRRECFKEVERMVYDY